MVPNNSVARALEIDSTANSPCATAARKLALTLAASSTPGGTRRASRSSKKAASPAGGFRIRSTNAATCPAFRGSGGGEKMEKEGGFASRRIPDQIDQCGNLPGIQGQRGNAQGSALGGMVSVGLQHLFSPV